jgi:L-threonylcarbamoyladenylate synthase
METIKLDDIVRNDKLRKKMIEEITTGKIFIYPTDTIYGIGCNAMDSDVVQRIREIKKTQHAFSVIVPSKGWIKDKLIVNHPEYLKKLPGPFTLIFKKKNPEFLSSVSGTDSLGIRIPKHTFTEIVLEACVPFVTTSANLSGQPVVTKTNDILGEIKNEIDYIVDAGVLNNPPSKVIDLTSNEPKVIRE